MHQLEKLKIRKISLWVFIVTLLSGWGNILSGAWFTLFGVVTGAVGVWFWTNGQSALGQVVLGVAFALVLVALYLIWKVERSDYNQLATAINKDQPDLGAEAVIQAYDGEGSGNSTLGITFSITNSGGYCEVDKAIVTLGHPKFDTREVTMHLTGSGGFQQPSHPVEYKHKVVVYGSAVLKHLGKEDLGRHTVTVVIVDVLGGKHRNVNCSHWNSRVYREESEVAGT